MRKPDLTIGSLDDPQTERWHLFRIRGWQFALHKWHRSDDDRALHDHVGDNISFILNRGYWEVVREYNTTILPTRILLKFGWQFDGEYRLYKDFRRWRKPWRFYYRKADQPHRVEIPAGPVWSLWFRWPPRRQWGFHCPKGWRYWQDYCDSRDDYHKPGSVSTVGKGCE